MIYVTLNSSCLSRVGYARTTGAMEVTFTSGSIYSLSGVPEYHFRGLINAASAGEYWNTHLKGNY